MDRLPLEPGAFYLMDRGYLDFARLFVIHQGQGFLCDPRQAQYPVPAALFASGGSDQYNGDLRSNRCADEIPGQHGLPRNTAPAL